jgi:aspartate/methionine/tyrosine aminotransferase
MHRRGACCWPPPPTRQAHRFTPTNCGEFTKWSARAEACITLIDEIYLGLSYDVQYGQTALALDDQIISINSFSKYFNMTGWRLGWMVVPETLVGTIERLAQNLFICPSTVSQMAALACFEPASLAEYERTPRRVQGST